MRLLLDTHALIWAVLAPAELTKSARDAIEDRTNAVFFSAASIWEIAIKAGKGTLEVDEKLLQTLHKTGFNELAIKAIHADTVRSLPTIHRDPFDRILIAQAQFESMTLVTRDSFMARYNIATLEA
jgi:PIN domain nuclease of toxin-antitoxin system